MGGKTLVELTRSNAWHLDSKFDPHDFRVGDLARIQGAGAGGKKGKGKEKEKEEGIDAVVYKVGNERIVLVLDEKGEGKDEEGGIEWGEKVNMYVFSSALLAAHMGSSAKQWRSIVVSK